MGYLCRKPTSNDPPRPETGKSRWLEETDLLDETALLLGGLAEHCKKCGKSVRVKHLVWGVCPDCREDYVPATSDTPGQ